jgi:hypothetical protein
MQLVVRESISVVAIPSKLKGLFDGICTLPVQGMVVWTTTCTVPFDGLVRNGKHTLRAQS